MANALPDKPGRVWIDTGSGPGMELELTEEDMDAARILTNALMLYSGYRPGAGDDQDQDEAL